MTAVAEGPEVLACAHCRGLLTQERWSAAGDTVCPRCHGPVEVFVFAALSARVQPVSNVPAAEGEASCFYHPAKKAATACDQCGRLLCSLCEVDFEGGHWCPQCIDTRRRKGKLESLETQRMLFDNAALLLATLPLLVWPFTIFTAPMAIYVVVRYWRAPSSITPRWRFRFYIAGLLALAQVTGWLWLFGLLMRRIWA